MIASEKVFEVITSTSTELKNYFDQYIYETYTRKANETDRLTIFDAGEIGRFVVRKFKAGETGDFEVFFKKVEMLLVEGDECVANLIIVGLLEGIQNICSHEELDYHHGFDHWLKPQTQKAWNDLIYFWESDETKRNGRK